MATTPKPVSDSPKQTPPPLPPVSENEQDEQDTSPRESWLSRWLSTVSTSWLASLCLHFVLVLVLALWSLPSLPKLELSSLVAGTTEDADDFEDVPLVEFEETEVELEVVELTAQPVTELISETTDVSFEAAAPSFVEVADFGVTTPITSVSANNAGTGVSEGFGRGKRSRALAVQRKGGSKASERAVSEALDWLARHQNPNGSWTLQHQLGECNGQCRNPGTEGRGAPEATLRSATALALLPFLGAGQTHQTGKHKEVVSRGLTALVAMGKKNPKGPGVDWSDPTGHGGYSHAIATLALTEALGITGDYSLQPPAQTALDFIAYSQGPDGSWYYTPRRLGDTSVTGWDLQALKSGFITNLNVSPAVVQKSVAYLNSVSHEGGSRYSYAPPDRSSTPAHAKPRPPMTAVGLLCRMYLGWKQDNAALKRGVERLAEIGPSDTDFYYNYYAAQVLFQYTSGEGPLWDAWNDELRDLLIKSQETKGHERGSWFATGGFGGRGGRLYVTALAAMTLEVYYRYSPIYKLNTKAVEFPE